MKNTNRMEKLENYVNQMDKATENKDVIKVLQYQAKFIRNFPLPHKDDPTMISYYDGMVNSLINDLSKLPYDLFAKVFPIENGPISDNRFNRFISMLLKNDDIDAVIGDDIIEYLAVYPNLDTMYLYYAYKIIMKLKSHYE